MKPNKVLEVNISQVFSEFSVLYVAEYINPKTNEPVKLGYRFKFGSIEKLVSKLADYGSSKAVKAFKKYALQSKPQNYDLVVNVNY